MPDRSQTRNEAPVATGVQSALDYIARLRVDRLDNGASRAMTDPAPDLTTMHAQAQAAGFRFTLDELRQAFVIDWQLRRARAALRPGNSS